MIGTPLTDRVSGRLIAAIVLLKIETSKAMLDLPERLTFQTIATISERDSVFIHFVRNVSYSADYLVSEVLPHLKVIQESTICGSDVIVYNATYPRTALAYNNWIVLYIIQTTHEGNTVYRAHTSGGTSYQITPNDKLVVTIN